MKFPTPHSLRSRISLILPFAGAALLALNPTALGQSGTWTGTGSGNWSDTANWGAAAVANGQDATATFSSTNVNFTGTTTITNDAGTGSWTGTLGNLSFGGSNRLWIVNGGTLTLSTSSGTPGVSVTNFTTSGSAVINSTLAGTQGFAKSGTGTLVLAGANSYSGNTAVSGGILQIGNGSTTGNLSSGTVSFSNSSQVIFNRSDTVTVDNVFTGSGRIVQAGSGTLILTAANTVPGYGSTPISLQYSGARTIQGRAGADAGYSGNVSVASVLGTGAVQYANNGVLQLRANGADAGAQTLTFGNGLFSSAAAAFTVDVDRWGTSTGTSKTLALGGLNTVMGSQINVTGGHGYQLALTAAAAITLGGGSAGSLTLNPTSGNLQINGNVVNNTAVDKTLALDGTASGNVITGTIGAGSGSGIVSVTKTNTSTWTLSGNSVYTGTTTVTAGTLLVNGSLAAGSTVAVGASGTLGGSGTINGAVAVDGAIAPGNSPGKLTLTNSSVSLNNGSSLSMELSGTSAGTSYDQLALTSSSAIFSLNGTNNLQLTLGYTPTQGTQFTLVDIAGTTAVSGIFELLNGITTDLSQDAVFSVAGTSFKISYRGEGSTFDGAGNNVMLEVVPEPATWGLLAAGGVFVLFMRHRRRNAAELL